MKPMAKDVHHSQRPSTKPVQADGSTQKHVAGVSEPRKAKAKAKSVGSTKEDDGRPTKVKEPSKARSRIMAVAEEEEEGHAGELGRSGVKSAPKATSGKGKQGKRRQNREYVHRPVDDKKEGSSTTQDSATLVDEDSNETLGTRRKAMKEEFVAIGKGKVKSGPPITGETETTKKSQESKTKQAPTRIKEPKKSALFFIHDLFVDCS